MDEKTLRTLVAAGAVKRIHIVGSGARFHVEATTPNGSLTAETRRGKIKTWVTLDAAARWVRSLGMGSAQLSLAEWRPDQRELPI